ncbi:cyclic GMP-AMP synthase [Sparus aurata]|uniref:Cyclic GMP-AMP synthase n=1 Tax=Sparus aurata TaxID=8175 RepID=A0A671WZN6_SPAAU|nr:cyclic GMP-AMP synthase [Sparus aurata]
MTGRGRPRKDKSPDKKCAKGKTRPEEIKPATLLKCTGKENRGESQSGTAMEQKAKEQKKKNHTEEKPSAQGKQKEETKKHSTEEQQRTPTEHTKAKTCGARPKTTVGIKKTHTAKDSPKTGKAKTCGGNIKLQEKFPKEVMTMWPEMLKDATKASPQTAKAKTCGRKAELQVQFAEEPSKDNLDACVQTPKPKARAGKVKSPPQFAEKTATTPLEKPKSIVRDKRRADKVKSAEKLPEKAAVDSILSKTLVNLKIRKKEISDAAEVVNKITNAIINHMKQKSECFKEVGNPLRSGSYYEKLKISKPDEFDVMVPMLVDRASVEPFGKDGAFYSVGLKRGNNPLKKFQEEDTLSASDMLKEFREEVKKSVKGFTEWEVTKKKRGCPAVTLITQVKSITISLDIVLCLMVKSSWPSFTNDGLKIEGWLGTKVKREYKQSGYYLVPKYEGNGNREDDGVLAKDSWRVSFSHIEKAIMKNHGSEKTCCEQGGARCCRKDCLKLLKNLLSELKESDSSFDKFCSYHVKTTLLHACCSRTKDTDWSASSLSHCFQQLLQDFVAHLESGELNNFFIPTQNLLSGPGPKKCNMLACRIREECDRGFPIFQQKLQYGHKVTATS